MIEVLRAAESYLNARGVDAPRRSVELLMARALGMSRLELYLAHDRPMGEDERRQLRQWIAARGRHVPVAHLLGHWEFYGLELEIGPDVLIPRPETEQLVELAIELAPRSARCVDIGTGSGAIAVAVAAERPDVQFVASDVSNAASAVARRNVARHDLGDRIEVVVGPWWEPLAERGPFDLLVANPPYVDPDRPELLADDVREHEPAVALFTPAGDPAAAYREVVAGVPRGLAPGAWLILETGVGASEPALAVLEDASFLSAQELRNDLAGQPRILRARYMP